MASPPLHQLGESGAYIVTAGTYLKELFFRSRKRIELLQEIFFDALKRHEWSLNSWSHFPNHYHFVGNSENASSLSQMMNEFHSAPLAN